MTIPRKRVLCVDDDADNCNMLAVWLSQAGFAVETAESPDEGCRLAASGRFDVFLLDLWFKGGEEFELCRRIREIDAKTPVVIYSADARQNTQNELAKWNIQAFLVKPTGLDRLVETIKKLTD